MAAAAIMLLSREKAFKGQRTVRPKRITEPLTVHLEGIVDEDDADDAIEVLEGLAERDSHSSRETMSRFTTHGTWLQTRFIATKARLFLLVKRSSDKFFEVVDSIPMHEISKVNVLKDLKEFVDEDQQQLQSSKVKTQDLVESKTEIETAKDEETAHDGSLEPQHNLNSIYFTIQTQHGGFNQGRKFVIDAGSATSCQEWVRDLRRISKEAQDTFRRRNTIEYYQRFLRNIHDSTPYRVIIFLAIAANFVVSMMEAQLGDGSNPCGYEAFQSTVGNETIAKNTDLKNVYEGLDLGFTIFFLIGLLPPVIFVQYAESFTKSFTELLFNFTAHAVRPFFEDKWNWFDVVVVFSSVAFLFVTSENNGLVKQLRIIRVFRVLRAFGKIRQMREMVNAIIISIIPAIEALVIGLIVLAIYANIGREFFWAEAPDAFCDFFHAFYTLFSVVAYLAYSEDVKVFDDGGYVIVGSAVFIYSFVAFAVLLFLQIVVAVLLENFYKAMQKEREESAKDIKAAPHPEGRDALHAGSTTTLDPILEELAVLDTDARLRARADEIFRSFDVNATGGLSYAEIFDGLYKAKAARFQIEDFHRITEGGKLCDAVGEIDKASFRKIMARQVRDLVLRQVSEAQSEEDSPPEVRSLLVIAKVLLIELEHAAADVERMRSEVLEAGEELEAELAAHRAALVARGERIQSLLKRATQPLPTPPLQPVSAAAAPPAVVKDTDRPGLHEKAMLPTPTPRTVSASTAPPVHALLERAAALQPNPARQQVRQLSPPPLEVGDVLGSRLGARELHDQCGPEWT